MKRLALVLFFIFNNLSASIILEDFKCKGYHEILNKEFGQDDFNEVCVQLDSLITFFDNNPEWTQTIYFIDQEFKHSPENNCYGTPPIGYIDDVKSGKTKKKYVHFTKDYWDFLAHNHPEVLSGSNEFNELMKSLNKIATISEEKFREVLLKIDQEIDISKIMYTDDKNFLILVKIVRYEPSHSPASSPHVDFSGLSFLFDNSENECESLIIAPYKEHLFIEHFVPPERQYKKDKRTSSLLLIPGLALKHAGLPIEPTPHAVKQQDKQRYAIIVFAMVPNVKLSYEEIKIETAKLKS